MKGDTVNKMNSRSRAAEAAEDVIAEASAKAKRARGAASRTAAKAEGAAREGLSRATEAFEDLQSRDIVDDMRDLVRRHPAATLVGAVVVGAALSQIVLRSARR